jgi:hypothetical protein
VSRTGVRCSTPPSVLVNFIFKKVKLVFFKFENIKHKTFLAKCIGCGRVQFGRCRDDGQTNTLCGRCGKRFFSQHCFDEHLKASCRLYHKCAGCKASYRTDKGHVCGNKFCKVCKLYHDPKRPCYIEPLKPPKSIKPTRIVVFDFEVCLIFCCVLFKSFKFKNHSNLKKFQF